MSEPDHKPGILNGYRVPLIIHGSILLPIVGVLVTTWADVRQLKEERLERVSGERIARIEAQIESLQHEMKRKDDELRRTDEASRQDRDRIWRVLEREHGERLRR